MTWSLPAHTTARIDANLSSLGALCHSSRAEHSVPPASVGPVAVGHLLTSATITDVLYPPLNVARYRPGKRRRRVVSSARASPRPPPPPPRPNVAARQPPAPPRPRPP